MYTLVAGKGAVGAFAAVRPHDIMSALAKASSIGIPPLTRFIIRICSSLLNCGTLTVATDNRFFVRPSEALKQWMGGGESDGR